MKNLFAQSIPLVTTVLPLQFAKSAILWNPVIFLVINPMVIIYIITIMIINDIVTIITMVHSVPGSFPCKFAQPACCSLARLDEEPNGLGRHGGEISR